MQFRRIIWKYGDQHRHCRRDRYFILPFEGLIFASEGLISSWKVLAAVWSSCSVENPLVPASEERNSTIDAYPGALKTHKTANCRSVNF